MLFAQVFLLAILIGAAPVPTADANHRPVRVLFIGNSFTFVHEVPELVAEMAHSHGRRLYFETIVKGGQTLEGHWKEGRALAAIHSRKWDFVVLQDHSFEPVSAPDELMLYGRKFAAELESSTRLVLFETWAYEHELKEIATNKKRHALYPEMWTRIHKAYAALARSTHALVAPVGQAWERLRKAHPEIELYARDGKHASPIGGYLAALVIYRTLFHELPSDMPTTLFPHYNEEDAEEFPPQLEINEATRSLLDEVVRRTPENLP